MRGVRKGTEQGSLLARRLAATPTDDCVIWPRYKNHAGYGKLTFFRGERNITVRVSRYVYSHANGWIDNKLVLHNCDNPSCINLRHLYLGDVRDNTNDKMKRGRWGGGKRPSKIVAAFDKGISDAKLNR